MMNLSVFPFLGIFALGLILGKSGQLGKLAAISKSEVAPILNDYSDQREDEASNSTALRGTINNETVAGIPIRVPEDNITTLSPVATVFNEHNICSLLSEIPGLPFSASHMWTTHSRDILAASQHSKDPKFLHKDWMSSLFATLRPEMLQKGLRAKPSAQSLQRVLDIVRRRISDPKSSPPLRIAVVGGSVTQGGGCVKPPVKVEGCSEKQANALECAWPKRFELVVNKLLGMKVVEVYNLAVGGTSLQLATPLIKYWLYPDYLLPDGPDVIISSYSTNEQHTWPYRIDTTNSTAFAEAKRRNLNNFISAVHNARPCDKPPFLLFLDDYLGNQQDRIVGETTYNRMVTELAEWYGDIMHVSYADVVRRHVYANTNETLFTADWKVAKRGDFEGQPRVEVHFGMGGHVTIAWTLLFNIAQVISGFCENELFVQEMERLGFQTMIPTAVSELTNNVPPPALTTNLMLNNVTAVWRHQADQQRSKRDVCSDKTFGRAPCSFAFIAGPAGTVRNGNQMQRYLKPFVIQKTGWGPVEDLAAGGWSKKLGLVAKKSNATLTLRLTNLKKEVRMLNLQTLKSYGDKWAGSKARFTLEVKNPGPGKKVWTDTFDIVGFHDSQTSISYV